jgi:hypothetical protein
MVISLLFTEHLFLLRAWLVILKEGHAGNVCLYRAFSECEIRFSVNYMYLAINTGSSISIPGTYIVFLTKMQKRANPVKWICPY